MCPQNCALYMRCSNDYYKEILLNHTIRITPKMMQVTIWMPNWSLVKNNTTVIPVLYFDLQKVLNQRARKAVNYCLWLQTYWKKLYFAKYTSEGGTFFQQCVLITRRAMDMWTIFSLSFVPNQSWRFFDLKGDCEFQLGRLAKELDEMIKKGLYRWMENKWHLRQITLRIHTNHRYV